MVFYFHAHYLKMCSDSKATEDLFLLTSSVILVALYRSVSKLSKIGCCSQSSHQKSIPSFSTFLWTISKNASKNRGSVMSKAMGSLFEVS